MRDAAHMLMQVPLGSYRGGGLGGFLLLDCFWLPPRAGVTVAVDVGSELCANALHAVTEEDTRWHGRCSLVVLAGDCGA